MVHSAPAITEGREGRSVRQSVEEIGSSCVQCRKCLTDCTFLAQHGTPGQLARNYTRNRAGLRHLAFSCSLCNLCNQVCPLDLEPARMFLDLRREAVELKNGNYKAHRRLLSYEKLGSSRLFRYLALPPKSTTLFFPGCALPGARPDHTLQLYLHLKTQDPTIGIMLDCCNKPSHDLGRQTFFEDRCDARNKLLQSRGIRNIITACPNCYQAFSLYGNDFKVSTAYSVIADNGFTPRKKFSGSTCTIHDPCSVRFEQEIHQAVRSLTHDLDVQLVEMEHNRATTLCCGEGGGAGCMGGGHAAKWSDKRHGEADGQPLITYCAGCTAMLQHHGTVHHIVDLLFPGASSDHTPPQHIGPPMTYINRLKLKHKLNKLLG